MLCVLLDPKEDFAGIDGLAFFGEEFFDLSAFGRANFILHFHGFDDEQALTGFDEVALLDEQANHFTGHGCGDLLAAFGFDGAMTATAPGARVGHFGVILGKASVKGECAVGTGCNADLMRIAVQQHAEDIGSDFDGIGIERVSIERDFPSAILFSEFDDSGPSSEQHFVLHGRRSSC